MLVKGVQGSHRHITLRQDQSLCVKCPHPHEIMKCDCITSTGLTWQRYANNVMALLYLMFARGAGLIYVYVTNFAIPSVMDLLPDTQNSGCACAGNTGNVFPATDLKGNRGLTIPAFITARAWDAYRDRQPAVAGKTFPAFPAHAQPAILRIWQEAHAGCWLQSCTCFPWGFRGWRWFRTLCIQTSFKSFKLTGEISRI